MHKLFLSATNNIDISANDICKLAQFALSECVVLDHHISAALRVSLPSAWSNAMAQPNRRYDNSNRATEQRNTMHTQLRFARRCVGERIQAQGELKRGCGRRSGERKTENQNLCSIVWNFC